MEGIPSDLLRECLLRVPYKSHDNLKGVCKEWEAMVSSPKFYDDRKIFGTSEHLLCFIQQHDFVNVVTIYDPTKATWETLPPITDPESHCCRRMPNHCGFVAVNRKLVLIGGTHPCSGNIKTAVYIYDFKSARWSRGADMPTPRLFFVCSVSSSTGLIYVAGGLDPLFARRLQVAEAYDVEKDRWEILPPMIEERGSAGLGVFRDEKFMILGGRWSGMDQIHTYCEVFDPCARRWTRGKNMFWGDVSKKSRVANSSSGDLYLFSEQLVKKYDAENNVWNAVASLPQYIPLLRCATQWRDWIFVSGAHDPSGGSLPPEHISYLFNPLTGQWMEVKADGGENFQGLIVSAATLEI